METQINANVSYHRSGRFATITLNRPEKRNALNAAMVSGLQSALTRAGNDERVRVVILTGAGDTFSAGADLSALKALQTATPADNLKDSKHLAQLFRLMYTLPKPILARVNGHAIAGGAGLVAACDLSVAVDDAKFGFTEVRIGFVPAIVMYFVLNRVSGAVARDLLLRGRLISTTEAMEIGMINEAVPKDQLNATVSALADEIASETSATAVALTKRMLGRVNGLDVESALNIAAEINATARETDDCRAGIAAFLNKKDPPWRRK